MGTYRRLFLVLAAATLAPLSACSDSDNDSVGNNGGTGGMEGLEESLAAKLCSAEETADHEEGHDADEEGHDADEHAGHDEHSGGHCNCGLQENCSEDSLILAEGLTAESAMGLFTMEIAEHTEWSLLDNEWQVRLSDANGDALDDARVFFATWSTDCGHCGPVQPTEAEVQDGVYTIKPAFSHGGLANVGGPWEVRLLIARGDDTDTIYMEFCVPGEDPMCEDDSDAGMHEEHEDDAAMHEEDDAGVEDGGV